MLLDRSDRLLFFRLESRRRFEAKRLTRQVAAARANNPQLVARLIAHDVRQLRGDLLLKRYRRSIESVTEDRRALIPQYCCEGG